MHSWARHLVQQAQQQVAYTTASYHHNASSSTTILNEHRDTDLPIDSIPLLLPASPSRPRSTRSNAALPPHTTTRFTHTDAESDTDAAGPFPQSIDTCPTFSTFPPLSPPPPRPPQSRLFLHDRSLHPSIRQHVFKYSSTLTPTSSPPFFPLHPDAPTLAFLTSCTDAFQHSASRCCSLYYLTHTIIKPLVSLCLSHTDVNGLLNTGHMFLLSPSHFLALYSHHVLHAPSPSYTPSCPSSPAFTPPSSSFGSLLDVGAGSGHITSAVSPFFSSTTVTEVSWMMTRRLARRGYSVHHTATLSSLPSSLLFDVVLCFNVLDRCSHPRSLLQQLRQRLRSTSSLLLLATPLPLDPWVEVGKTWKVPEESLGLEVGGGAGGKCAGCMGWEETVERLSLLFIDMGFVVLSVSRLPYVSAGNAVKPFFTLDDALFALAPADNDTRG